MARIRIRHQQHLSRLKLQWWGYAACMTEVGSSLTSLPSPHSHLLATMRHPIIQNALLIYKSTALIKTYTPSFEQVSLQTTKNNMTEF